MVDPGLCVVHKYLGSSPPEASFEGKFIGFYCYNDGR
jgi:hypothetical protein